LSTVDPVADVALDVILEHRRPVLRLRGGALSADAPSDVLVTLTRRGHSAETFTFRRAGDDLLSVEPLSPPLRFDARVSIGRGGRVSALMTQVR
jgi:hypothetical protein